MFTLKLSNVISASYIRRITGLIPRPGNHCFIKIEERQKIEMIFHPAKGAAGGYVWYFICPVTNIRCRKLHLVNGNYMHRTMIRDFYRVTKPDWWSPTAFGQLLMKEQKAIDAKKQIAEPFFKTLYNGKPTKRYLKLSRQIVEGPGLTECGLVHGHYADLLKIKPVPKKY